MREFREPVSDVAVTGIGMPYAALEQQPLGQWRLRAAAAGVSFRLHEAKNGGGVTPLIG